MSRPIPPPFAAEHGLQAPDYTSLEPLRGRSARDSPFSAEYHGRGSEERQRRITLGASGLALDAHIEIECIAVVE